MSAKDRKMRIAVSLDRDVVGWLRRGAIRTRRTLSGFLNQLIAALKAKT